VTKYLKLFEDYTDDSASDTGSSKSWSDLRDRFQSRLPYVIIDFEDSESRSRCIESELYDEAYVKQRYHVGEAGGDIKVGKYPSIFIFEESDKFINKVLDLIKNYNVKRVVVGKMGEAGSTLYMGGESMDYGGEVITSLSSNDIGGDDYYKFESTYYRLV